MEYPQYWKPQYWIQRDYVLCARLDGRTEWCNFRNLRHMSGVVTVATVPLNEEMLFDIERLHVDINKRQFCSNSGSSFTGYVAAVPRPVHDWFMSHTFLEVRDALALYLALEIVIRRYERRCVLRDTATSLHEQVIAHVRELRKSYPRKTMAATDEMLADVTPRLAPWQAPRKEGGFFRFLPYYNNVPWERAHQSRDFDLGIQYWGLGERDESQLDEVLEALRYGIHHDYEDDTLNRAEASSEAFNYLQFARSEGDAWAPMILHLQHLLPPELQECLNTKNGVHVAIDWLKERDLWRDVGGAK